MKGDLVLVLCVLFLAACGQDNEIRVGFMGPLSGSSAIIGQENLRGIQLAVDEFNGRSENVRVRLLVKDDRLEDKETVTQYRQMVHTQDVRHFLTVTYGGFMALAGEAEEDGTVLINSLDASEELVGIGNGSFAIGIYDESIAIAIAEYLDRQGVESIGLVKNVEDPFIKMLSDVLDAHYQGEIVEESYTFDTADFRTILSKLSSQERIVLLGWEETGTIVRQARELGIAAEFVGIDTFASESFRKNAGHRTENLAFTFWEGGEENPAYAGMLEGYRARFGMDPENVLFVATGYDAAGILLSAIARCAEDVACVRERIRTTREYAGATGSVTVDADGITRSITEGIYTYDEGAIVPLREP